MKMIMVTVEEERMEDREDECVREDGNGVV